MSKQRVFLTGATGTMGFLGMQELLKDSDELQLVILARPSDKNKQLLEPFLGNGRLEIVWGDLTDYDNVHESVKNADIVLHVGAFVSPEADYHPKRTMEINYGSTVNIVQAVKELGQEQKTRVVYIGTVAETGDRMPPIHWGRVGDPIKPSVFDYYAVYIAAYWGSKKAWEDIPPMEEFRHFTDWDKVIHIDRGYDESKPEESLELSDMKNAVQFRCGECLSSDMETGNWTAKLEFNCAFGHTFKASPRLVLEGGHWCPHCERESWNYYERAKRDPFFAQVWNPLHPADEKPWSYPKAVSELDVKTRQQ